MGKYVINTMYLKAQWVRDPSAPPTGFNMKKIADDALIMVIHDDDKRYPEIQIIERPTIEWYSVKENVTVNKYNEMSFPREDVDVHVCEYSKREADICRYLNIHDEYRRMKSLAGRSTENWIELNEYINENIMKSPYIYGADLDIEDYYKTQFMREHGTELPKNLNISYFDIENYIFRYKTQVDQNNPIAPTNVITYVNNMSKEFHALVLLIDEIDGQKEIMNDPESYIKEYLMDDFLDTPELSLHIKFFESEILMIKYMFSLIHMDKPEICLAWNSNYDYKYLIGRMKNFGVDPKDCFCHPDIPDEYKTFHYKEDRDRSKNNFSDSSKHFSRMWDWMTAPGYTVYLDQMSCYSNLRKRFIEKSYRLDAVAEKEIKANKVDLHSYGMNIRNGPFKNFPIFLKYSCRDTKLLYCIEKKNMDMITLINLADNTKLEKATSISFVIRNAFYWMFLDENRVMGNTIDYGVREKIDGAIVGDPLLVDSYPITVEGKKTQLYKFVIDLDASSEYPSLMKQLRIGKNNVKTRITHIIDEEGKYLMSGKDFNSMLQTKDTSIIDLANVLYELPTMDELVSEIEKNL